MKVNARLCPLIVFALVSLSLAVAEDNGTKTPAKGPDADV